MSRPTSRDYAHPRRPWVIRALDAVGRVRPFDVDRLVATAVRQTGSDRFASEAYREPLERMLASVQDEARLTPVGRFMTAQHVLGALRTNLRAGALLAERPALRDKPLPRVILVCGLGRSGTTLLQRLLARLPGARAIPAWEAYDPVPEPGARPGREDPRIRRQRQASRFLRWLSPDLFAVHPMDALAPEEDVLLLQTVFMSSVAEATWRVPTYAAWLEQQDQRPAYRWLADCVRILSEREDGEVWVLKAPHHLEWLDLVFETFPDVTVVQTHRDPVETVPSFCSLVAHGWGVMSDHVDPHEVGRHWSRKIERMLGRALAVREARADRGFVDVPYGALTRDPVGVVEGLCARLGLPFDEAVRAELEGWLATEGRHRHGVHRYAAEDFGLRTSELAERFAAYRARFVATEAA